MMDKHPHRVMPALGAGTHAFLSSIADGKAWMAGPAPGH
jgi:hypothetical protein